MKIALVADLHGNRPATLALEKELARLAPDRIYCLGDIVGKGPSSDFTFDWAFANCDLILGGNWDYGVGQKLFPNDEPYWEQLGEKRLEKLCALPLEHEMVFSGRKMRLFHGRPVTPNILRSISPKEEVEAYFEDGRWDVVIYGDIHRQSLRTMTPGMLVNTGSVGNALGEARCCFAILEGEEGAQSAPMEFRFRQVDYDRAEAVRDAMTMPGIMGIDCYIRELETGRYCRAPYKKG